MPRPCPPRAIRVIALCLGICGLLGAPAAIAQSASQTAVMTCASAAGMLRQQGAIVLHDTATTYDRFVRDAGSCQRGETTEPAYAQTRDNPQCFIGFRCVQNRRINATL